MMKYAKLYLILFLISAACDANSTNPAQTRASISTEVQKKVNVLKEETVKPKIEQARHKTPKFQSWYSPFVIDISSPNMVFKTISFKDVSQGDTSTTREAVMETLAESLGMSLAADPAFKVNWEMRYDKEITDPANHKACGQHHLYVDVWAAEEQWGYSLWSGCSSHDEFAKASVAFPKTDDPSVRVAPLVKAIHDTLREAHSKKCFEKNC